MRKLQSIILFITGLLFFNISASAGDTITTASGIKYVQLSKGHGLSPVTNQKVKIVYTRKSSTGVVMESNELSKPLKFKVDADKVIPGLDEIVKIMRKGEEVYCVIPADLGHGKKGVKGYIDSNSTLYIYIQIIDIQ